MSLIEIGCCGAYCRTCIAGTLGDHTCKGCRMGYDDGRRDIGKARCAMKVCCIKKLGWEHTCADCDLADSCSTLQGFYSKKAYKYGRYRKSMEFIRSHGYDAYLDAAVDWKQAYGKLP